jgi:membrane-associated phospholipid phosphatase
MAYVHRAAALAAVVASAMLWVGSAAAQTRADEGIAPPPPITAPTNASTFPLDHPLIPHVRPARTARRPYALTPAVDLSVLAAGAALWIAPEFMLYSLVPRGRCPCDPAELNDLDRGAVGLSIPGTGPVSNAVQAILMALPAVIDIFDVWESRGTFPEWIEDAVVIGESLVVGGAINEVTKLIFQRPRPQGYGIDPGDGRLGDPDTYLSFYSLAAAEVFTAAVAGSVTFALRHPTSPWRWVYLGASTTLAAGFGLTRVLIGRHFPTDVLAAAAIGSLVGVLVPWVHRRPIPLTLGASVVPGAGVVTASMPLP